MEYYVADCADCGAHYRYVGYKTGLGKSQAQLEQMKRDRTVCRECGGRIKQGLDHESPGAQALDGFLGSLLKPKEVK